MEEIIKGLFTTMKGAIEDPDFWLGDAPQGICIPLAKQVTKGMKSGQTLTVEYTASPVKGVLYCTVSNGKITRTVPVHRLLKRIWEEWLENKLFTDSYGVTRHLRSYHKKSFTLLKK